MLICAACSRDFFTKSGFISSLPVCVRNVLTDTPFDLSGSLAGLKINSDFSLKCFCVVWFIYVSPFLTWCFELI